MAKDCVQGVLLITPCALMFDPTELDPDNGLILPMTDVKRAALYNRLGAKMNLLFEMYLSVH